MGVSFLLLSHGAAAAEQDMQQKPPMPLLRLQHAMNGEQALLMLADKLPAVAAAHGMTVAKFRAILQQDKTAWLDHNGRMFYVEPGIDPAKAMITSATATVAQSLTYPAATTFQLHSLPGAERVIYLDFDGETVTGTAWNTSHSLPTINAAPLDFDGNPTTFNDAELAAIQDIWKRVAEDYAPYKVDVTTQLPAASALTRSNTTDTTFGMRVVITRNWTLAGSRPCQCGGVAYLGVFDETVAGSVDVYKPAWVFTDSMWGSSKYIAEAVSHEVGHTLGLSHDGSSTTTYYEGHGSGASGWAPIMGVGYYKLLSQWSRGEYPGANKTEDDLAIMQATGAPFRNDDHGNTSATATSLPYVRSGNMLLSNGSGIISSAADEDYFSFATTYGDLELTITPETEGNLQPVAYIYDLPGNLISVSGASGANSATLRTTGVASTSYRVRVYGSGKYGVIGDPGFSNYGSIGQYKVAVKNTDRTCYSPWLNDSGASYGVNVGVTLSGTRLIATASSNARGYAQPNNRITKLQLFGSGHGGQGAITTVCNTDRASHYVQTTASYWAIACDAYNNCAKSTPVTYSSGH